jgi:hypothetical protein
MPNLFNTHELFDMVKPSIKKAELTFKRRVITNYLVFEEVMIRSNEVLERFSSAGCNPSCFKRAGHYAFWLRKLKPFRVLDVSALKNDLEAFGIKNCDFTSIAEAEPEPPIEENAALFVNEMIAAWTGFGLVNHLLHEEMDGKVKTVLSSKTFVDFYMGFRYRVYSPDAMVMILEAAARQVSSPSKPLSHSEWNQGSGS